MVEVIYLKNDSLEVYYGSICNLVTLVTFGHRWSH